MARSWSAGWRRLPAALLIRLTRDVLCTLFRRPPTSHQQRLRSLSLSSLALSGCLPVSVFVRLVPCLRAAVTFSSADDFLYFFIFIFKYFIFYRGPAVGIITSLLRQNSCWGNNATSELTVLIVIKVAARYG